MSPFTFIVRCLLVVAGIVATTATVRAEERTRPDVVFIIVDDLNDWLGCLGGHPDASSPNIDALAASGMLFSQAYCNSPQCRPSRTSLLTGVYPFKTGTYFNARDPHETKKHDADHAAVLHGKRLSRCERGQSFRRQSRQSR